MTITDPLLPRALKNRRVDASPATSRSRYLAPTACRIADAARGVIRGGGGEERRLTSESDHVAGAEAFQPILPALEPVNPQDHLPGQADAWGHVDS